MNVLYSNYWLTWIIPHSILMNYGIYTSSRGLVLSPGKTLPNNTCTFTKFKCFQPWRALTLHDSIFKGNYRPIAGYSLFVLYKEVSIVQSITVGECVFYLENSILLLLYSVQHWRSTAKMDQYVPNSIVLLYQKPVIATRCKKRSNAFEGFLGHHSLLNQVNA